MSFVRFVLEVGGGDEKKLGLLQKDRWKCVFIRSYINNKTLEKGSKKRKLQFTVVNQHKNTAS